MQLYRLYIHRRGTRVECCCCCCRMHACDDDMCGSHTWSNLHARDTLFSHKLAATQPPSIPPISIFISILPVSISCSIPCTFTTQVYPSTLHTPTSTHQPTTHVHPPSHHTPVSCPNFLPPEPPLSASYRYRPPLPYARLHVHTYMHLPQCTRDASETGTDAKAGDLHMCA